MSCFCYLKLVHEDYKINDLVREAAKKVIFLMAVLLRGEGGIKGLPLRKKRTFFCGFFFYLLKKFRLRNTKKGFIKKDLSGHSEYF